MAKTSGCALSGFVLVKKVPGTDESAADCVVCRGVTRMAKTSGCALSGFVLVKKVPGALHFLAKSPGHSFDYAAMNMSHVVNYLYFGNKPSPRRHQVRCAMMTPAMRCRGAVPEVSVGVCMTFCVCEALSKKGLHHQHESIGVQSEGMQGSCTMSLHAYLGSSAPAPSKPDR